MTPPFTELYLELAVKLQEMEKFRFFFLAE